MKLDEVVATIPTVGFNVETVEFKNIRMTAWDAGGSDKNRSLWRHYYQNTRAIVFVVDSNDRERINDASEQLHSMLIEDELRDIPVVVLANKQDLLNAMSPSELTDKLGLEKLTPNRKWYIQATVATQKQGLWEGFEWLADVLVNRNTFEAVLWAFWNNNNFQQDVLHTVNLGDDTKATAAIYAQLAGAYYGYDRIPIQRVNQLYANKLISCTAEWLYFILDRNSKIDEKT
ncbi:unnamed protein product [Rotaria sordida]|uniref:ADP-ribosylation factor n=1 Tax=Rotaria sordida TaxID=392033 RepID=A0A818ZUC6_9BILA|nr:unnamed protein product [Rotaria sordida]CAF3768159.1 unnamed protein product [Rotaria sordida]